MSEPNDTTKLRWHELEVAKQRDRIAELERQNAELRAALQGIEIVEHGEGAAKVVWFLLRSDGNEIGAGSVRLDGAFAEAMSKHAKKRRAALQAGKEPKLMRCAASRDGECGHAQCPQLRDGEPKKTGRHCPLDTHEDDA